MKIEPIFTGAPALGRKYKVPTVVGHIYGQYKPWPVLGPAHDDKEIIGFDKVHYHLDLRFISEVDYDYLCHFGPPHRHVLYDYSYTDFKGEVHQYPLGPVVWRWRKYYREMPPFPQLLSDWSRYTGASGGEGGKRAAPWMNALEKAYENHKLGEDMICPHRGASLREVPSIDDCITCPLHGLRWDTRTGELRKFSKEL